MFLNGVSRPAASHDYLRRKSTLNAASRSKHYTTRLDKAIVCSLNMDSVSANLSPDRVHLLFNPANLFREALIRVTYQLILVCGASNEVGRH